MTLGIFVVSMNVYAALLVILRAGLYKQPIYRPMLLNIWLSILPVLILGAASLMLMMSMVVSGLSVVTWIILIVGFLAWLLALPNSAYLITELNLNHRAEDEKVPLWYDILSVLTLVMSGVLNLLVNLLIVNLLFMTMVFQEMSGLRQPLAIAFSGAIMVLVSFGIYLGRYLRFNSWDIRHPRSMGHKIATYFLQTGKLKDCALFVVVHSIFFAIMYGCVAVPMLDLVEYSQTLHTQLR
ncbi:DUF1361 domain-containing protein [Arthrobacter sp. TMN-49]